MFRCYSYTIIRERINSYFLKSQLLKYPSVCGEYGRGVAAYIRSLLVYVCCTAKQL